MPYLKINYDDSKPTFEELELPEDVIRWLDAVHNILGCRTIQTVPTVFRGIVLVIDDDGKLKDGWKNRINKVATAFLVAIGLQVMRFLLEYTERSSFL